MKLTPVQVSSYFMQQLRSFRVLIELSERQWREESALYERSLNIDKDELLSWERYGYRNDLGASIMQEFPQYQRRSQLIMVISLFEDYLNQLCLSFEKANKLNIVLTDFRGSGIERAKNYLKKGVGIHFPSDSDSWKKILDAQLIRNVVAHNGGHIEENQHTKHLPGVEANNDLVAKVFARRHLIIEADYLPSVVTAMETHAAALQKVSAST